MRHRNAAVLLLRSSSTAAARRKPTAMLAMYQPTSPGNIITISPAATVRSLHNTSARMLQQGAAAGQGEEGWTGGDGTDRGHAGARILGIVFFSSLVGALVSLAVSGQTFRCVACSRGRLIHDSAPYAFDGGAA